MSYDKPLSYSGLSKYKECPRAWADVYINGNRTPPSPAMERGTRIHEVLELYFNTGMYPDHVKELAPWRATMDTLKSWGAVAEQPLAVDRDWNAVSYDDPAAFFRGKTDLSYQLAGSLYVVDFKTGRKYPSHVNQGRAYVALTTAPSESYIATFMYLDHPPQTEKWHYTSAERDDIIAALRDDIDKVRSDSEYAPTPSPTACRWCTLSWRSGGDCHAAP